MSDTPKIQDTPAPQGTVDLSTDAANGRVRGGDFDQNQMANCVRGAEVTASSADVASRNHLNDGAGVSGIAVTVSQTSHRAIEGSNAPGDFRKSGDVAAASLNAVSGSSKGPRDPAGQFPNGKNCR